MHELPFAAITLAELSVRQPAQTLVLTVNNRLARTLTADLAKEVKEGSAQLIPIEPWTTWLTNQVVERLYAGVEDEVSAVLDTQTARLIWAEAIKQCETERSLIDIDQVASIAAEADALILNWHIEVSRSWHTPDFNRFIQWRDAYEARLSDLEAIDVARVPARVVDWIARGELVVPPCVVLLGFTELSASMRAVLDAMRVAGVDIRLLALLQPETSANISKVQLATPELQWSAAIAWARENLMASTDNRFAIVVPSLQAEAGEARRLLERELDGLPYNVAVAPPLAQWPLARAMLGWLRLVVEFATKGEVQPSLAGEALLAGGCAGSDSEAGARAMLDARWRQKQWLVLSLAAWQDEISTLPKLSEAWQAAMSVWRETRTSKHSWLDWANLFRRLLAAIGFPGEGTQTSVQYQTTMALDQLVSTLAGLDDSLDAPDATGAWQMLARLARQTLFQPQRDPDARLDVLGLLEAEGGRWDGVWVMGVTDDVLPAVVSPNPLIPVQALAQANAPRSTAQREYQWASELMQALERAGTEVVFSWAARDGEQPNRPSPFLARLPQRDFPPQSLPAVEPLATQTWTDGPDIAIAPTEKITGGVAVLQTQATNPLWAFFQHRLNVRGMLPHAQWPATFDRGNFLHRILELLWQGWGDQSRMLAQVAKTQWPNELRELIDRVAADKLAQWPHALRELEKQRGYQVISDWLAFEATREPFKVVERECEHQFREGQLSLRLTIDRIDELVSGERVVFDYKSGSKLPQPASDWQSMSLRNAQLLVYASVLASEGQPPDALAWIWLHAAGVKLKGLAGNPVALPGIEQWAEQKWAELDWDLQLKHWDERVRQLAREFAAGKHDNYFWQAKDRDYCNIKPLLRLHAEVDDE